MTVALLKLSLISHARINSPDKVYQVYIASLKLYWFIVFIHHSMSSFGPAIIEQPPQSKRTNPACGHQPDSLSVGSNCMLLVDNGWRFNMSTPSLTVSWADISVSINFTR